MKLKTTIKGGPRGITYHEREDGGPSSAYVRLEAEHAVSRTVTVHFDEGNVTVTVDGRQVFPKER